MAALVAALLVAFCRPHPYPTAIARGSLPGMDSLDKAPCAGASLGWAGQGGCSAVQCKEKEVVAKCNMGKGKR